MRKIGGIQFVLGILVGTVIFGGTAAAAAGILAQPKTAAVIIDGQAVNLNGYLIGSNHYFQLRDLDEKLKPSGKDFSIVWDGAGNRVIIDTSRGYDSNEQYVVSATPAPSPGQGQSMTIDEMRGEIIRLTNIERVKAGLPELVPLPAIMDSAQAKAQDFIDNHYYGHISPIYGTPGEMVRSFVPKARLVGENIASWRASPAEAVTGWADSPPHYANIINPAFTHIGVGLVEGADGGCWCVQQFAEIP